MKTSVARENVIHLSDPKLLARLLAVERIDIWPYEKLTGMWILDANGYEVVWTLAKPDYYFAFNKATDDTLIHEAQQALNQLITDGTVADIITS